MNYSTNTIILSIITIISSISTAYFFSLSGININNFLTINFFQLLEAVLTIQFALFLIFASLSISAILSIIKNNEFLTGITFSLISYILGAIIGTLLFGLINFLIPILFGSIGIFLAIKTQEQKEKEYKSMPILRAGINSAGKVILFISIGFFVYLLFVTIPNQVNYEKQFSNDFLSITIGGEKNSVQDSVQSQVIDIVIQTQKETLNSIKQFSGFSSLQESSDISSINFYNNFVAYEQVINSNEYKNNLKEQNIEQNNTSNLGKTILDNLPFIEKTARYAWLLYALSGLILTLFLGNLIIKNLAGIFYFLLNSAFNQKKPYSKLKTDAEENENY